MFEQIPNSSFDQADQSNLVISKYIDEFSSQKREPFSFFIDDRQYTFKHDKRVEGQTKNATKSLQNWAEDPFNLSKGEYGYAFELMTNKVLNDLFKDDSDIVVRYSPSVMDFTENKSSIPSVDLILLQKIETGNLTPLCFINTALTKRNDFHANIFPALNIPIIGIRADSALNSYQFDELISLASTEDVGNEIDRLTSKYKPFFIKEIEKDINILNESLNQARSNNINKNETNPKARKKLQGLQNLIDKVKQL